MHMEFETGTLCLILVTLSISAFYQGVYSFCHTMALVAAGLCRCHSHSGAQSKREYLI